MANRYTQLWVFDVAWQIQFEYDPEYLWMVRLTKTIGLRPWMSAWHKFILSRKWQPLRNNCVLLPKQFCECVDSKLLFWRQVGKDFRANAPHFRQPRLLLLRLQGYAPRFSDKNFLVGRYTQVPQNVIYWADWAEVATETVFYPTLFKVKLTKIARSQSNKAKFVATTLLFFRNMS
jgi:hypothetical protein